MTDVEIEAGTDEAEPTTAAPRRRDGRALVRRAAVVLGLVLAVVLVYGTVVASLIFQQRQDHLASAAKQPAPSVAFGDPALTLQIPDIGLDLIAIDGVTVDHLRGGPAREHTAALPGDAGVVLVYGHRDAYGGPFRSLQRLAAGGGIYAQSRNGPIIKYAITDVLRHSAIADWKVPVDARDLSYLVLVTSEGGILERDQLIVVAKALPVGTTPARIPDLQTGTLRGRAWIVNLAVALLAIAAALGSWRFLRGRTRTGVRVVAVGAMVALAIIEVLMAIDSFLPLVR